MPHHTVSGCGQLGQEVTLAPNMIAENSLWSWGKRWRELEGKHELSVRYKVPAWGSAGRDMGEINKIKNKTC